LLHQAGSRLGRKSLQIVQRHPCENANAWMVSVRRASALRCRCSSGPASFQVSIHRLVSARVSSGMIACFAALPGRIKSRATWAVEAHRCYSWIRGRRMRNLALRRGRAMPIEDIGALLAPAGCAPIGLHDVQAMSLPLHSRRGAPKRRASGADSLSGSGLRKWRGSVARSRVGRTPFTGTLTNSAAEKTWFSAVETRFSELATWFSAGETRFSPKKTRFRGWIHGSVAWKRGSAAKKRGSRG
jgi:hypothetical protein